MAPIMTDETAAASTDLVFAQSSLQNRMGWAKAVAAAGDLVPKGYRNEDGSANPAKVLVAAEYATMIGLHPLAGLTGINVIDGKASLSPALMSALIRRAGHKLRVTTTGTVEGGDFAATATIIRRDDPDAPYSATWTPQRAQRAGLCTYTIDPKTKQWAVTAQSKYGKTLPWQAYTEALCKARAISEVAREAAEDVLFGIAYTSEELGADPDGDDGGFIDVTPNTPDVTPTPEADEPIDAEVVDERTGEIHESLVQPRFDPTAWEDRIADALGDVDDLRRVYADARTAGVLDQKLSNGEPIRTTVEALAKRIQDQQEHTDEVDA
jgi:hypothetical protein